MKTSVLLGFSVFLFLFAESRLWGWGPDFTLAGKKGPELDVIFEPSPAGIVQEMIRIAGVNKDDVVYDLGCGDGRIVIAAVEKTGCRGVGIDLDPERIKESRANAEKAGVSDRVQFIEQDLFKADVKEATVVMLFLFPDVNLRLRPKLLNELKPGARIVSHMHSMGEWKADKLERARDWGRNIHCWVVPAQIAGAWKGQLTTDGVKEPFSLKLKQKYQDIRGAVRFNEGRYYMRDARLDGTEVTFRIDRELEGRKVPMIFSGSANGDVMSGNFGSAGPARIELRREKSTLDLMDLLE